MEDEEPYTSCQKCKVRRTVPLMSPRPLPLPFSSCGLPWSWEQSLLPDSMLRCLSSSLSSSAFLFSSFHLHPSPCPDILQSSISCSLTPDSCTCRLWKAEEGCDPFNPKGLPAKMPLCHLPYPSPGNGILRCWGFTLPPSCSIY